MTELGDKIEALHRDLSAAGVPHAFGGALALAFCTQPPRATADIDLNVFVPPQEVDTVCAALPDGVQIRPSDKEQIVRDGQVRLWWDEVPLDLFFGYHAFHDHVSQRTRLVPFGDTPIPVIDCTDLAVFKAIFGRLRDWADIEAMAAAGTVNAQEALGWVGELLGADGEAFRRLAEAFGPRVTQSEAEALRRAFGTPPSAGSP